MATSTVLDAIELFNVIGQHYAHPRLDPASPPLALAGAMLELFTLVQSAFRDVVLALDVDLTRLEHFQSDSHRVSTRQRLSLSPDPEDTRIFVPREDVSAYGSSPLSSPAPATPSDFRAPAWGAKGKGEEVAHYPPAPASSFSFSSVDWNGLDGDTEDESDIDAMDETPALPPAPPIAHNVSLSVLRAPYMVPQPRGTSSRPPPLRGETRPSATGIAARRPAPSSASSSGRTASSSASTTASKSITVRRKSPPASRPLAKRHSAPEIEPRRATRTAKANAHASWSWLVSKRRKSGSTVAEEDGDHA
ncbi:hypothetical protein AURDEDRAFT_128726 [Auricularia subglabra TFB-10046 SS5]|nr:hypothetical protein AURDEDRAFT_128726 [Auricularia subglabra TFB-10046 SS5]